MKCPECGSNKTLVNDSRKAEGTVIRERFCPDCRTYFWTREEIIPTVIGRAMRTNAITAAMKRKEEAKNEDHRRKVKR